MANENTPIETPVTDTSENIESEETSQEETEEAAPAVATPALKAQEIKYLKSLKLKVDKGEVDEELPFELPDTPEAREYMTRQLQLAKMGQKRAQDFSSLEKEVAHFVNLLKTNPREALRNPAIGVDVKKLAAEILEEEIQNSQKTPEQIEKEALQKELQGLKDEREKEKKDFEARELERLTDLEFQRYDEQIDKALEKHKDLPKSPYVVKKVAEYMMLGLQNNINVSAEDVMSLVKQEIQEDIKNMFGAMPDEVVEQFLGKDRMSSMRKKNLAKAKATPITNNTSSIKDATKPAAPKEKKGEKKMTYKEFFKGL